EDPIALGNSGRPASSRVLCPFLRKIQTGVDQGRVLPLRQGGEDSNLTVVDLPQTTGPLPCDPYGLVALLATGTLVQKQAGVRRATQMAIGVPRNLSQDGPCIPLRMGDEMLERLVVAMRYDFFHAFDVFATRLRQSLKIVPSLDEYRPS